MIFQLIRYYHDRPDGTRLSRFCGSLDDAIEWAGGRLRGPFCVTPNPDVSWVLFDADLNVAARFNSDGKELHVGVKTVEINCKCADSGCPIHKGHDHCIRDGIERLYRFDMADTFGTLFCNKCAADAFASGLFDGGPDHGDTE